MSFRELRNLCEMTRSLGYPRLLSIDNFRTPNFPLVAELLEWICKRYDPNASLSASLTTTMQERVIFIKQAVLSLLQNSRLKLNPKKLYQADGLAVQELLIPIRQLYEASQLEDTGDTQQQWQSVKQKLSAKMQEVRVARQVSSQLPQTAAALHDLLGKELLYRKQRSRATSRTIPLADAERVVKQSISQLAAEADDLATRLNNIATDEAALDEKIERRKREYEQLQKRFAKLQNFRPQYMEEYEGYEQKLKDLYEVYVLKFRNLTYLQQLMVEIEKSENQKREETEKAIRQVVDKTRADNSHSLPLDALEEPEVPPIAAAGGEAAASTEPTGRRVFGNMVGAGMSSEEDSDDEDDMKMSDISDDNETEKPKRSQTKGDDDAISSGDDF